MNQPLTSLLSLLQETSVPATKIPNTQLPTATATTQKRRPRPILERPTSHLHGLSILVSSWSESRKQCPKLSSGPSCPKGPIRSTRPSSGSIWNHSTLDEIPSTWPFGTYCPFFSVHCREKWENVLVHACTGARSQLFSYQVSF